MISGSKRKKHRGFTLVEILVATFLVVISLVGLLSSYIAARHSSSVAKHQSQAINILQEKIEQMKSLGYDQLLERSQTEPYQYDYDYVLDSGTDEQQGIFCFVSSYVWQDSADSDCLNM